MGVFAWKTYGLVKDKTVPFLPNSGYLPSSSSIPASTFRCCGRAGTGGRRSSVPVEKPRLSILNTYYRERAPGAGRRRCEGLSLLLEPRGG